MEWATDFYGIDRTEAFGSRFYLQSGDVVCLSHSTGDHLGVVNQRDLSLEQGAQEHHKSAEPVARPISDMIWSKY